MSTSTTQLSFYDMPKFEGLSEHLILTLPTESRNGEGQTNVRSRLNQLYQGVKSGFQRFASNTSNARLSTEDVEKFNNEMRRNLESGLRQFGDAVMEELAVTANDSLELAKLKLETSRGLLAWLRALGEWLSAKLRELWQKIKDSFKWVVEKTKELFQHLFSLFGWEIGE